MLAYYLEMLPVAATVMVRVEAPTKVKVAGVPELLARNRIGFAVEVKVNAGSSAGRAITGLGMAAVDAAHAGLKTYIVTFVQCAACKGYFKR